MLAAILAAIRQLMHPPVPKRRSIGYVRFRVGQTVSKSRSDRCHKDAFT
jgi:hypothetical protein